MGFSKNKKSGKSKKSSRTSTSNKTKKTAKRRFRGGVVGYDATGNILGYNSSGSLLQKHTETKDIEKFWLPYFNNDVKKNEPFQIYDFGHG